MNSQEFLALLSMNNNKKYLLSIIFLIFFIIWGNIEFSHWAYFAYLGQDIFGVTKSKGNIIVNCIVFSFLLFAVYKYFFPMIIENKITKEIKELRNLLEIMDDYEIAKLLLKCTFLREKLLHSKIINDNTFDNDYINISNDTKINFLNHINDLAISFGTNDYILSSKIWIATLYSNLNLETKAETKIIWKKLENCFEHTKDIINEFEKNNPATISQWVKENINYKPKI